MVTLYRRHVDRCSAKLLAAKDQRSATGCDCPVWVGGKLDDGRVVERQSCKTRNWAEAEAKVKALLASLGQPARREPVPATRPSGPRISDRIKEYIDARDHRIGDMARTQSLYVLNRLSRFAAEHGIHGMNLLTADFVERFKAEGLPKTMDSSKATYVGKIKAFLKYAERRGWITGVADRVERHEVERDQVEPYTEEEVQKILDGCATVNDIARGDIFSRHPDTFRLLLELMLETGMRISDAMKFDPSKLRQEGPIWMYDYFITKRKRTARRLLHSAFLSDRLKRAIESCWWLSKDLPFWAGRKTYQKVRIRMGKIGKAAGISECRPHRLRHTFAVRKLLAGVSLDDVSKMLGHSSVAITEQSYAAWVPSRAKRLAAIAASSMMNP